MYIAGLERNALNCYPDNLKSKQMNIQLFLSIHSSPND